MDNIFFGGLRGRGSRRDGGWKKNNKSRIEMKILKYGFRNKALRRIAKNSQVTLSPNKI